MMNLREIISLCFILISVSVFGQTHYYVSTTGSDTNDGKSLATAFKTPNKATSVAVVGDLITVSGGHYLIDAGIAVSKAGTKDSYIKMFAAEGETPVFDCQPLIDAGKTSNSGRGMQITKSFWHIKGITVCNTNDRGITIGSSSAVVEGVILEGITIYQANNDGIALLTNSKNTLILNCDSHHNWERGTDGNNGDGFSAKAGLDGNVFRGCRAWSNADDGWDTYGATNSVLLDSCWSFNNGYNVFGYSGTWSGNGNGFKLGGPASGELSQNVLTNCIAFGNRSKGFDQNHSPTGQTMIQCTGYNNHGENGNFSFYEAPTKGSLMKHVLINCLSYKGVISYLVTGTQETTNSWNVGITITDNDFAGLDESLATAPRNADFTIPKTSLFRLSENSVVRQKGTDLGSGSTPDLGAFQYPIVTGVGIQKSVVGQINSYPNPCSDYAVVCIRSDRGFEGLVRLSDQSGRMVYESERVRYASGTSYQTISMQPLSPGIYYCSVITGSETQVLKIIKNAK